MNFTDAAFVAMHHALVMMRDADNDCRLDGLPTIPRIPRGVIDRALALAEGRPSQSETKGD